MAITILEDYLICVIIGIVIGVIGSWMYVRTRIRRHNIGQVIEKAIIEKDVIEIEILSRHLSEIVSRLKASTDDLNYRIFSARDIELNLESVPLIRENIRVIQYPVNWDILEENR